MNDRNNTKLDAVCSCDWLGDMLRKADEHDQLLDGKPKGPYSTEERQMIEAGNEARAELYRQAQAELLRGTIRDDRLRLWFAMEIDRLIEALPAPVQRPNKTGAIFRIALQVQIWRTDPETLPKYWNEERFPWVEELGMTLDGAVRKVSEQSGLTQSTVRTYYLREKEAAKRWIKQHGPRLPRITSPE